MRVPEQTRTEEYFSQNLPTEAPKSTLFYSKTKKPIFKALTCQKNDKKTVQMKNSFARKQKKGNFQNPDVSKE